MFYVILHGLPKYQMYIYCIHLFMSLFIIPLQSITGKISPNLWQKLSEKTLLVVVQPILSQLKEFEILYYVLKYTSTKYVPFGSAQNKRHHFSKEVWSIYHNLFISGHIFTHVCEYPIQINHPVKVLKH